MIQKKYGVLEKAAVLSLAILIYETSMTTPALGEIAKAFPNVSPDMVKQIASLPNLMLIIFSLLPGQLERFMSRKAILYIAMGLMFCGILPAFFGDMTFILFTRVVFGAGLGLMFPMASSIIQHLFDGKERDTMMGLKGATGAAAGVVFQTVGGILAFYNWRYCFLEFLIMIPVGILIFLKLPEPEMKEVSSSTEDQGGGTGKRRGSVKPMTIVISAANVLFNIVMFSFMTNTAMVLLSEKAGNAVQAGLLFSCFTLATFFAGLAYGPITSRMLKRYTVVGAVVLIGLAFVILLNANGYTQYLAGAAVFGIGFGTYNPEVIIRVMSTVRKSAASIAIGIYIACQGVGQFLSPIILAVLIKVLGLTGSKAAWEIAAYTLLVGAVILFIIITINTRRKEEIKN